MNSNLKSFKKRFFYAQKEKEKNCTELLNIILLYIDAFKIHHSENIQELHRTLMTEMLAALFMVLASYKSCT